MKTKSIIFIDIFAPKWTRAQRKLTRFPSRDFRITPRIERINRELKQTTMATATATATKTSLKE